MESALRHARQLQSIACKSITNKYDKPFLTASGYDKEIGKFSEIAGHYHAIVKQIKKMK